MLHIKRFINRQLCRIFGHKECWKQGELLDFVKLCQEVANKANEVVQIIDSAGKDAMSMAYATMEDGIGDGLLDMLREKIDAYGHTPEGRKYFNGDHLSPRPNNRHIYGKAIKASLP